MASLIVQENGAPRTKPAVNGEEITIQAPCDCSAVTGVMIGGVVFPFYDACGNNVSNIDGKFGSGSLIRVMIDTINTRSYILNQASPVEKFHAAHHAAGGDDPITPTAIGAQNRLAWVTETSIDAMFSGTYSGEEDESAEASSVVLAAIADLQEQVGELEDEIREVAENVTGEPCDCSKYDAIASAEAARQSAEAASQSAENARQNAIAAGSLATQAVASASLADQRATEAERYAAMAERAIGKTSYIDDDGNWYAWDALLNDFVNTGVRAQGDQGEKGDTGEQGIQGEKGDKGDKGETGAAGKDGAKGDKGDKGDAFTYSDFTTEQLAALKGEKGDKGDKGETGEPGKDGADGKDGAAGEDGVSCTHSWDGTVLTITSASGTSSADLKGPPGDSGGQEEAVTEILLYEDLVVGGFEQDETGVFATTVPIALPLVVGTKYKVIWDGTEYICECYDEIMIEGVGTAPGLFLGNGAIMVDGAHESDEPFIVIVGNDSTTAITTDSGVSHIISLYERQGAPKLPMITAEDNDKFLCVVNGEPAWVAMTDVSKEGA